MHLVFHPECYYQTNFNVKKNVQTYSLLCAFVSGEKKIRKEVQSVITVCAREKHYFHQKMFFFTTWGLT